MTKKCIITGFETKKQNMDIEFIEISRMCMPQYAYCNELRDLNISKLCAAKLMVQIIERLCLMCGRSDTTWLVLEFLLFK